MRGINTSGKRRGVRPLIAAAALCAIAGGSSNASAKGQGTATGCVKVGTLGTIQYGADGSIVNLHTSENLTVSCPVDWDGGGPFGSGSGVVEYIDSHAGFALTCTLRAEIVGTGTAFTASKSSPAGTNADAYLTMTIGSTNGMGDGGVHLVCTIPKIESGTGHGSYLVSYSMQ